MPARSRRKRGKNIPPSKRKKQRASTPALAVRQQAVLEAPEPTPAPDTFTPAKSEPVPEARPEAARYPYINSELLNIGVLAVIMLIILVVLASVLS
jgi:hypothetical protein